MAPLTIAQRIRRLMRQRSVKPSPTRELASDDEDEQDDQEGIFEPDVAFPVQRLAFKVENRPVGLVQPNTPIRAPSTEQPPQQVASTIDKVVPVPPRELIGSTGLLSLQNARRKMGLSPRAVSPLVVKSVPELIQASPKVLFQAAANLPGWISSYKRFSSIDSEPDVAPLPGMADLTPVTSHENPNKHRPHTLGRGKRIVKNVKHSPITVELTKFMKIASPNVFAALKPFRH